MFEAGFINKQILRKTIELPLTARFHQLKIDFHAPFLAEVTRQILQAQYGDKIYTQGYKVYTTVNSTTQLIAQKALQHAVFAYDQRHGFRGALKNWGTPTAQNYPVWQDQLHKMPTVKSLHPAVVVDLTDSTASAMLASGNIVQMPFATGLAWARFQLDANRLGPTPQHPNDVLKLGDVIYVHQVNQTWQLSQIPKVEAALISVNPHTGGVLSWVGGFDYQRSRFDRINRAQRQAGSNIKPFLYTAALAKGYTLATVINDAPVVVDDPTKSDLWRPQNANHQFYGPTRMRMGLIKSRNLVSIRLLQRMGIPYTRHYITRFGFKKGQLPNALSLALGAGEVTPLQLVAGYSIFANGGYKITPFIIDKVLDSDDTVLYQAKPDVACEQCMNAPTPDNNANVAPQVISPQEAYLITSALRDVILHGTGRRAKVLGRHDIAGKTGSTNHQNDAWFSGFNSDVVTTVWMGYDQPRSLHEYAATTVLPMWIDYMKRVLQGKPEHTMMQPPGLITLRIDPRTGRPSDEQQSHSIFELFRTKFAPHKSTDYYNSNDTNNSVDHSHAVIEELF